MTGENILDENLSSTESASGQTDHLVLPPELKGWNWGAFLLNWIWGIFNGVWISLFALIPIVNIVIMVILGVKGNQWAWENKDWENAEHFKKTQKNWALAGFIVWGTGVFFLLFSVVLTSVILMSFRDSDISVLAMRAAQDDPKVSEQLGSPLQMGYLVLGNIETSGPAGKAEISIPIIGTRERGTLYVNGEKSFGKWKIKRLVVMIDEAGENFDVTLPSPQSQRYPAYYFATLTRFTYASPIFRYNTI